MSGYVYIMSNPAFPNLIKIGKTKNLKIRRNSLYTTGSPFPFKVEHYQASEHHHDLEKRAQLYLSRYRVNRRREFFEVDIQLAKECIAQIAQLLEKGIKYLPMQRISDEDLNHLESPWSTEYYF